MGLSNYCRPSFAAAGISGCGRRKKFPGISCILIRSDRLGGVYVMVAELENFSPPCSGVLVWKFGLSLCSCFVERARVSVLHGAFLVLGSRTNAGLEKKKKALQISAPEMEM